MPAPSLAPEMAVSARTPEPVAVEPSKISAGLPQGIAKSPLSSAAADVDVAIDEPDAKLTASQVKTPDPLPAIDTGPARREQVWNASNGSTLQATVADWARRAGWAMTWEDDRPDLEVIGTVSTRGSFIDAVGYLFDVYHRSGATYDVTLFAEQKLVLIRNTK